MLDEALKTIWDRAASERPLSRAEIEELLRPMARWSGRALEVSAWIYGALLLLSAGLGAANLSAYRGNRGMLAVEGGLLAASIAGAGFSFRLVAGLRRIARADLPLVESVERRLAFHDRWSRAWLVVASVTPWMLALAINTCVDNLDGTYSIHHPIEFAVMTAAMIGITFVLLRASLVPSVRSMRAVLHDLRAEALEKTTGVAVVRRRTRVLVAIGTALLVLGVLAGLWLWWFET